MSLDEQGIQWMNEKLKQVDEDIGLIEQQQNDLTDSQAALQERCDSLRTIRSGLQQALHQMVDYPETARVA